MLAGLCGSAEGTIAALSQGEGELDFDRILSSLEEIGYDGWITVELDTYAGSKQEAARNSRIFLEGRQESRTTST